MDTFVHWIGELEVTFGPGIYVILLLMLFIGAVGQYKLYEKCGIPGIASLIPGWNVTAFMKIVGRPGWHALYLFVPIYNLYFIVKVYIELCHCFGRHDWLDYTLAIALNGLYVLNLGMSYQAHYHGPVYGREAGLKDAQLA